MFGREGYYSLIQYCPDRSRAEAANIGVMLFCLNPHYLGALVGISDAGRLKRFFGDAEFDVEKVMDAAQDMAYRINHLGDEVRTLDSLRQFIGSRGNDMVLTDPRLVKVADPEPDMAALFAELVESGRPAPAELKHAETPVLRRITEGFGRLVKEGRARESVTVMIPVVNRTFAVPFAYRNGVENLVRPEVLGTGDSGQDHAMVLAIEGDLLAKSVERGMGRKLVVVSAGREGQHTEEAEARAAPLFAAYCVELVPLSAVPAFLERAQAEAKG